MFPFYTIWKHQKNKGFLLFLGGIKWEHWLEIGYGTGEGQGSHQGSRIFTSIQLLTKTKTFSAGIYLFKVNTVSIADLHVSDSI